MTEPARKKPPADNETSSAAIATRQEQYQRQPHKNPAFSFRKNPLQREREKKIWPRRVFRGHIFFCQCLHPNRDKTELDCEHNVTPPCFLRVTRELVETRRDGKAGKHITEIRNPSAYSTPKGGRLCRGDPLWVSCSSRKTITEPGHRSRRDARPPRARQRAYPARQPGKWHRRGW